MADRVELLIKLTGDQEAIRSLDKLEQLRKDLNGKKIELKMDATDIQKQINSVKQQIEDVKNQAKLKLITEDDAKAQLDQLTAQLHQLQSSAADVRTDISEVNNALSATSEAIGNATAAEQAMAEGADNIRDRFEGVLSVLDGISQALNFAAGGVDLVNNFASGIFNTFEQVGNMFSFNIIDKALDTMTSMITQNLVGNMDRIISRYDIMSTFSDYMSIMGVTESESAEALARINESILGLPIGLDEAAYRFRRYQMFIGDIERSTNFTIGIQKAIMAGGASESMKNQAYMQIERLLTTGSLSTARQWMSLLNGLGVSTQFVAEALGRAGMSGKDLAAALYGKQISVDEFLDAITSLGEGTSEAALRLDSALEIYKTTIESKMSNIEFAFVRGGQQTMDAFNKMLMTNMDTSITGYLDDAKHLIDDTFKEIRTWITDNPDLFELNFEALDNFATGLERFDLGNIAEKGFEYIAEFIDACAAGLAQFDSERVENFIAFGATIAGPIAAIAKNAGPLGVAMGVVERFQDHDWGHLFELIGEKTNNIADITERLLDLIPDEVMDELLAFGVTYGPMIYLGLSAASKGFNLLKGALEKLLSMWATFGGGGLLAIAAGIAAIALAVHEFNQEKADISLELGFDEMDAEIQKAEELSGHLDEIASSYSDEMAKINEKADTLNDLLDKIEKLNDTVEKTGDSNAARELKTYVDLANDLFPDLGLKIDEATGALDENSRAVLANKDAYIELVKAMAQMDAAQGALKDYYATRIDLTVQKAKLEAERASLNSTYQAELAAWQQTVDALWRDSPDVAAGYEAIKPLRLSEMEKQLKELDTSIVDIGSDIDDVNNYINVAVEMVGKSSQSIERFNDNGIELASTEEQVSETTGMLATELFNVVDASESAASAAGEYNEVLAETSDISESAAIAIERFGDTFSNLTDVFLESKGTIMSTLDAIVSGFDQVAAIEPTSISDMLSGVESGIDYLQQYLDAENEILRYMLNGASPSEQAFLGSILNGGNAGQLVGVANALGSEEYYQLLESIIDRSALEEAAAKVGGEISAISVGGITNGLIGSLGAEGTLSPVADEFMKQYTAAIGESIKAYEKGITLDGLLTDSGTQEDITNTLDALRKKWFVEDDNGEESVGGAVSVMNDLLVQLYEDTYPTLSDETSTLMDTFDEFITDHFDPIVRAFSDGTGEVDDFSTAVNAAGTEMSTTAVEADTLTTSTNDMGDAMANQVGNVQAIADAIGAIAGEASAAASAVGELTGAISSIGSVSVEGFGPAWGGGTPSIMVPYASGGEVGGVYRGYDSVPSILTPGEFVLKRSTARALGRKFLDNLNRMNIPAAIETLMHQVSVPAAQGIVAYDNHRNYDNHATVNQYINTNNPGFTYRRASRFVGAL